MTTSKKFLGLLLLALIVPILVYIVKFFDHSWSDDPESWTHFAGYLGGIFSSLLGAGTFYLVYRTYREQQRITRLEHERSIKENTPVFVYVKDQSQITQRTERKFVFKLERNDAFNLTFHYTNKHNDLEVDRPFFQKKGMLSGSEGDLKLKWIGDSNHVTFEVQLRIDYQDISGNKYYEYIYITQKGDVDITPPMTELSDLEESISSWN